MYNYCKAEYSLWTRNAEIAVHRPGRRDHRCRAAAIRQRRVPRRWTWAYRRGVKLDYTRPGKPTDNGVIRSFNGRLSDEFLNVHELVTMHDASEKLQAWQEDYNTCRPHGSLGHLTPSEFVRMGSDQQAGSRQYNLHVEWRFPRCVRAPVPGSG